MIGLYRAPAAPAVEFYWVTDGGGRQLAVATPDGSINGTQINQLQVSGGTYAGGISNSYGFGASRFGSADIPTTSFFRSRVYDQESGRFTQEDPVGLGGGLNLYQYAGNAPSMFTDPFGLCKQNDPDCLKILAMLRAVAREGNVFQTAARAFDATTREVHLVRGDQLPLGFINRDGNPRTFLGGYTPRGEHEMWLNADFAKGDLLLAAVDEADHLMGTFHPAGATSETDPRAFSRMEKAYQQLSPADQATAPLHGDLLHRKTNGRVGKPLPEDYKEPTAP